MSKNPLKNLPIKAQNEEQKNAIISIIENDLTVVLGGAGSGKTYLTLGIALEHLLRDKIERIIISRPMVTCGTRLGAMPGGVSEKTDPYFIPIKHYINFFIGSGPADKLIAAERILLKPVEVLRGTSFDDTYLLLDEAQNCQFNQLVMFVTRGGKNSKVILNGDLMQFDVTSARQDKYFTDLEYIIEKCRGLSGMNVVELQQCLRNDFISKFLRAVNAKD